MRQQPVTVHARVPIEAAVERGMELARRAHVVRAIKHVLKMVRVLTVDRLQREPDELGGFSDERLRLFSIHIISARMLCVMGIGIRFGLHVYGMIQTHSSACLRLCHSAKSGVCRQSPRSIA